jgi:hypothetical protein
MSDWKNERAEAEMKLAGEQMMKQALEKKIKEENEKWSEIKQSLYVGSKPEDDSIDWVIDELKKKYELPNKLNNE